MKQLYERVTNHAAARFELTLLALGVLWWLVNRAPALKALIS